MCAHNSFVHVHTADVRSVHLSVSLSLCLSLVALRFCVCILYASMLHILFNANSNWGSSMFGIKFSFVCFTIIFHSDPIQCVATLMLCSLFADSCVSSGLYFTVQSLCRTPRRPLYSSPLYFFYFHLSLTLRVIYVCRHCICASAFWMILYK